MIDLPRLGQRQRLEELVKGAEAAGKDDEAARVLDEHHLAHEEVAKLDAEIDVGIQRLFMGQLDVAAHGDATRLLGPAVDRLHETRSPAGDDREPPAGQRLTGLARRLVEGVVRLGASRSEDADGGAELAQGVESLDEFREDSQYPPGIGVVGELLEGGMIQESLVGRWLTIS